MGPQAGFGELAGETDLSTLYRANSAFFTRFFGWRLVSASSFLAAGLACKTAGSEAFTGGPPRLQPLFFLVLASLRSLIWHVGRNRFRLIGRLGHFHSVFDRR
jgi:hypothetical protein